MTYRLPLLHPTNPATMHSRQSHISTTLCFYVGPHLGAMPSSPPSDKRPRLDRFLCFWCEAIHSRVIRLRTHLISCGSSSKCACERSAIKQSGQSVQGRNRKRKYNVMAGSHVIYIIYIYLGFFRNCSSSCSDVALELNWACL